MLPGERREFILFQKIIHTHPQQLGDEAYMVAMVKPVQQMNTFARKRYVSDAEKWSD
jgi:hypothetical protein